MVPTRVLSMKLLAALYTGAATSVSVYCAPFVLPSDELSKKRSAFKLNRVPFCRISIVLYALPPFRRDRRYA